MKNNKKEPKIQKQAQPVARKRNDKKDKKQKDEEKKKGPPKYDLGLDLVDDYYDAIERESSQKKKSKKL
ncbi:unnamed protein product [Amoebophrya sp. A120]|nr:unnamed protein product [Amoebophrya sp. A120]|eukprot:GSA120T00024393001.1